MKTVLPVSKTHFDAIAQQIDVIAQDWAERECTPFDEAIRREAGLPQTNTGSIWKMPSIDSKRVSSLLVELEPLFGCKLPSALIRRGGYNSTADLVNDLKMKIRQQCMDSPPDHSKSNTSENELIATLPSSSR